jgi:hypothetical protein
MNSPITQLAILAVVTGSSVFAAEPAKSATSAKPTPPVSFTEALTKGKVSLDARLRYEFVTQDGAAIRDDANALTVMARLGYTTAAFKGFQAMIQGEAVTPLIKDYFDGTGSNSSGYPVVADPEIYQLNQAWAAYTYEKTKVTVGRQKIILDNARFIGDVGWRQNDQIFDAVLIKDKSFEKTTLTYAYLDRVNRVFDDTFGQPDYDSNSHVFNASYAGCKYGTLTGYAYLLDFDADGAAAGKTSAKNNSSATYGLSFAGAAPVTKDIKATYRAEFATQTDYGSSALSYTANYYLAEAGISTKPVSLVAGYEVMGSDKGVNSFRTPLATLHAFDGWADVFLVTPAAGLTDTYLKASTTLPGKVGLTGVYHQFGTEDGPSTLGDELDIVASFKLNKQVSFTAKVAKFWSAQTGAAYADRTKIRLQTDYKF